MNYWLFKSEPDAFSIDDLRHRPGRKDHWDGIRNYQARNFMRDGMKKGDQVLFYHSNCQEPGIVGIAEVVREGYPDQSALDPESKYYDPKSSPENPRWFMVDVKFVRRLRRTITLQELKGHAEALPDFPLLQKGNRLSVMPVSEEAWDYILGRE